MISLSRFKNSQFLLEIYEKFPTFTDVEVTNLKLNRDGPTLAVEIITKEIPIKSPRKWGDFNFVFIELAFFSIQKIKISAFEGNGSTSISLSDNSEIFEIEMSGAAELSATAEFAIIKNVKPVLRRN